MRLVSLIQVRRTSLGERMGTYALFGGLVVLGGVILSAVSSARAAKESEQKQLCSLKRGV